MNRGERVIWRLQGQIDMLSLACTALIESHPASVRLKHYIRLHPVCDVGRSDDIEITKRINAGSRLIADLLVASLRSDPALRDAMRLPMMEAVWPQAAPITASRDDLPGGSRRNRKGLVDAEASVNVTVRRKRHAPYRPATDVHE